MSWENQAEEIKPGEKLAGTKGAKKGEIKAAIKEMNLLDEVDDLLDMPGLSVCLSNCLSVCLTVCLSVCLTLCLTVCLPDCLSDCLSVCLSV